MKTMSEPRRSIIVFLAGMGTTLRAAEATSEPGGRIPDFWGDNKLAARIQDEGLNVSFLVFSYNGPLQSGENRFQPRPYSRDDTLNHHISTYVRHLHDQLTVYARHHPHTDFSLVGHSEGGLIAYAHLGLLAKETGWRLPHDSKVTSVVTLDSPLGGIRNESRLRVHAVRAYLAVMHQWRAFTSFNDLLYLYRTTSNEYPLGGHGSVTSFVWPEQHSERQSNQRLAKVAREHGVRVLTIGNARDYCFAPGFGIRPFLSSQWISDEGPSSGIHGRWVVLGTKPHSVAELEDNHGAVLTDQSVHEAIISFLRHDDPDPLLPAPSLDSLTLLLKHDELDSRSLAHPTRPLHM